VQLLSQYQLVLLALDQEPQQVQQWLELEELLVGQNQLPNLQYLFPIVGSLIQVESAMLEGQ